MQTEYEAKFIPVDIDSMRNRLSAAAAILIRPEYAQRRFVFDTTGTTPENRSFIRVRDEGNKITLTYKTFNGKKIEDQKELEVVVNDFDTTVRIIKALGLSPAAYEETRREKWELDNVDITIDTWPFLGRIVEVEGKSEADVKAVSEKIGFVWSEAKFGPVGSLYVEKYGLGPADLAKKTGKMTELRFDGGNPFI